MSDLATLGVKFETLDSEAAENKLDSYTQRTGRAEKATDALTEAGRRASGAVASMIASIDKSVQELVKLAKAQQQAAGASSAVASATTALASATNAASSANIRFTATYKPLVTASAALEKGAEQAAKALGSEGAQLQGVAANAGRAEQATHGTARATDVLAASQRQAEQVARRLGQALGAMVGAFITRQLIQMADAWSDLNARVKIAGGEHDLAASTMDRLSLMARRTYSSLNLTTESYLLNSTALRELGYSTVQQLDFTEAMNNALVVSGARGQRAETVMNALSRAMAGGKLQGNDLNTIMQTGGRVTQALADALGVTTGELRKMSHEGRLTTDVLFTAMTSQLEKLREETDAMPATIGDGFTLLGNALLRTVGIFDQANGLSEGFGKSLVYVADVMTGAERPARALDVTMQALAVTTGVVATRSAMGFTAAMHAKVAATVLGSNAVRAYVASIALVGPVSATATAATMTFTAAARGAVALMLGPWGIAIAAVATGYLILTRRSKSHTEAMREEAKAAGAGGQEYLRLREAAEKAAEAQSKVEGQSRNAAAALAQAVDQAERLRRAYIALGIETEVQTNKTAQEGLRRARAAQEAAHEAYRLARTSGSGVTGDAASHSLTERYLREATAVLNEETAAALQAAEALQRGLASAGHGSGAAAATAAASSAIQELLPWETERAKVLKQIADIERGRTEGVVNEAQATAALRAARVQLSQIDETAARDGANKGTTDNAAQKREESLVRELESMRATTQANLDLAAAYGVSDAAAAQAAAQADAVGRAVRRQGDVDAFVAAQLELNASKAAVAGAEQLAAIQKDTAMRRQLNGEVASGLISGERANELMAMESVIRPLIAAGIERESDLIQQLTGAMEEANVERRETQRIAERQQSTNQLELLEREIGLIGASNRERAVALAVLQEEQRLSSMPGVTKGDEYWNERIAGITDYTNRQIDLTQGVHNYNEALLETLNRLSLIEDRARDAGQGMAEAFGSVGRAIGDITSLVAGYARAQEEAAVRQAEAIERAGTDQVAIARHTALAEKDAANAKIAHYGDLIGASKNLFDEQSGAYKALQAVEMVYRGYQMAASVAAIAQGWMETTQSVAQAGVKGTADTAAGGAKMFSQLGIYAFPVVAAMIALLAGLGGSGGSASAPSLPTMNTGTGTVLGDPNAESASISRSLDMAEKYQNRDLDYSSRMVSSLRAIEDGIGSVTTAIARQMGVGGGFDTSGLGLGTTSSRGFLGMGNTTRSAEVASQGLNLTGGNLGQMIANGVSGGLYQIVENTKTKSGFMGFGGGTTTWHTETSTAMDQQLGAELGRLLGSLRDGVLTAASTLGIEGAEATLSAMTIGLGRIDFEGLSSAEISERLSAVFSAAGDQMATAILPGLRQYQQAGEGMMETLARLATQYAVVDQVMEGLGMAFDQVGLHSITARDRLVQLAGGLEEFTKSAAFFAENFLTEEQRLAPVQRALAEEMARLGYAGVTTREAFASLVTGIDVASAAGAQLYASLMAVAPAFDAVASAAEKAQEVLLEGLARDVQTATDELSQARQRLVDAYQRERAALVAVISVVDQARSDLQQAYDAEASSLRSVIDAVESARTRMMQAYAEEVRALETVIGAVDDARSQLEQAYQRERQEIESTADGLQSMIDTLRSFRQSLAFDDMLPAAMRYGAARAKFTGAANDDLPQAGRTFLDASKGASTTRTDYLRDLAMVRIATARAEATAEQQLSEAELQLQALDRMVAGLIGVEEATLSVAEAVRLLETAMAEADKASEQLDAMREIVGAVEASSVSFIEAFREYQAATISAEVAQAQLDALDRQVAGLINVDQGILSVTEAVAQMLSAQQAAEQAQAQIEALDRSVEGLIEINASVLSVADGILGVQSALAALAASQAAYAQAQASATAQAAAAAQAAIDAANRPVAPPAATTPEPPRTTGPAAPPPGQPQTGGMDPYAAWLKDIANGYQTLPFANGGVFTNNIVSSPTLFNMGLMGEAGPEAIMPLATMPGGGLGVRSSNDNSAADAIRALQADLARERSDRQAEMQAIVGYLSSIDRRDRGLEVMGWPVRGEAPGEPVQVAGPLKVTGRVEVTGPDGAPVVVEDAV